MERRRGWWVGGAVAFAVGVGGLVWFLLTRSGDRLQQLDSTASVTSLVVGIAALVVSAVSLAAATRGGARRGSLSSARNRLAKAVRHQWNQEIGARGLRQPRPLRLSWSPTARERVSAKESAVGAPAPTGSLTLTAHERPTSELVTAFRDLPSKQLVVLGQPGAGKSVVAMLFTVDLLDTPESDAPVPVLLPVAGWDPREDVRDWVARRVHEEYPDIVTAATARELVAANLVMPVLDGLDEMPRALLPAALTGLDRVTGDGLRLLVTCRGQVFEQAVREDHTQLSRAAVVEIEPVATEDAAAYLDDGSAEGDDRWAPVVDELRAHPDAPLAQALSTPLMLSLARAVYRTSASDPSTLVPLAANGPAAVEDHLLARFIPDTYADSPYPPAKAERWLRTLAHHLTHPATDRVNLNWWQFDQMLPARLIGAFVTSVVTVGGMAVGVLAKVMGFAEGLAVFTGLGLVGGVLAGLATGRAVVGRTSRRLGLTVVGAALRDGAVATAAACLIIASAGRSATMTLDYLAYLSTPVFLILISTIALALMGNGLALARSAAPARPSLHWGGLLREVKAGIGTMVLVGIPTGVAIGVYSGLRADTATTGLSDGVLATAVVTVVLGTLVGIARALAAPATEDHIRSPRTALSDDGTALSTVTLVSGLSVSLLASAAAALLDSNSDIPGLAFALVPVSILVIGFGSGAAWLRYHAALALLALRRRLPWHTTRFLEDARGRGVLRQSGASYQFRHKRLMSHLAPTPAKVRVHRFAAVRRGIHTGIAVVVLAAVTATVAVPSVRSAVADRNRASAVGKLRLEASMVEATDPTKAIRLLMALAAIDKEAEDTGRLDLIALRTRTRSAPTRVAVDSLAPVVPIKRLRLATGPEPLHTGTDRLGSITETRAMVTARGVTTVWDLNNGWPEREFELPWASTEVAVTADGTRAVAEKTGRAVVWDVAARQAIPLPTARSDNHEIRLVADRYAFVSSGNAIAVFDIGQSVPQLLRTDISVLVDSTVNDRVLVMTTAWTPEVWDIATGQRRTLGAVSLSHDGQWVLTQANERLELRSLTSATTTPLPDHSSFTIDGNYLVVPTEDNRTELRSLDGTTRTLLPFPWRGVEVSKDGRALITSVDNGKEIWALDPTPRRVTRLSDLPYAAFTHDGTGVITVRSTEMTTWNLSRLLAADIDPGPKGLRCTVAERGLTESEWAQYAPGVDFVQTC
ncbi:hypothetical protein [Actinokineospora terrae]|uniref:NACHT domain-containing protein n=1 Tax=Actinokineospora terrae TaxID=155974 RepID=A0A1H9MXX4_9PSEU|nr:hypothetical protein [Actinokineospora terrae]SER28566.1 hypothetical protein SAMN04487818_102403 [Actinokineospora terrae]